MSKQTGITVDTSELTAALSAYMPLSRSSLAKVCNRKAVSIARNALWNTPKTPVDTVHTQLGKIVSKKKGGKRYSVVASMRSARNYATGEGRAQMSLAEALIRAKDYQQGKPQRSKQAMDSAIVDFLRTRSRSVAYLASGWVPAIMDIMRKIAGELGVVSAKETKMFKRHGRGIPASDDSWHTKAVIENSAARARPPMKILEPVLQAAFDKEAAGTMEEVEKRLREAAGIVGIKTTP